MLAGTQWILFDAVGTLIYPYPSVAEAYQTAGRRFGSRLTAEEISRRFASALQNESASFALARPATDEAAERQRWRGIVAGVMDDVVPGDELFSELWQHFARPQSWRVFDDVGPAVADLTRRGFRLGIASNFDRRLRTVLAGHPAVAACEHVFISSEIGYAKPDPKFFAAVQAQLGVAPAEILLVGDDAVYDVEGATRAGWRAVFLDRSTNFSSTALTVRSLRGLLD